MLRAYSQHNNVPGNYLPSRLNVNNYEGEHNMRTEDILLLNHKMKYQELVDKIDVFRNHGKPLPLNLILQAEKFGRLAQVPDTELRAILFNLKAP